jgi:2Fe-2S ferredoxin
MSLHKITINFENKGKQKEEFAIAVGENVLDVCLDNGINLQHNCGGVCGCSTCHVYINKAISPRINSRLACQCIMIDGDIEVTIPDQSQFLGH